MVVSEDEIYVFERYTANALGDIALKGKARVERNRSINRIMARHRSARYDMRLT